MVTCYFSVSSESWFPKWLSHTAEKIRWKSVILWELDLGLYKYVCIVEKKHFSWKIVIFFSTSVYPQPPRELFPLTCIGNSLSFRSSFPCLCFIHVSRWDAAWGSSVLQQLNWTKLLSMGCCFLVIWKENFSSLWRNALKLCCLQPALSHPTISLLFYLCRSNQETGCQVPLSF